jgi:hypothetical protein
MRTAKRQRRRIDRRLLPDEIYVTKKIPADGQEPWFEAEYTPEALAEEADSEYRVGRYQLVEELDVSTVAKVKSLGKV